MRPTRIALAAITAAALTLAPVGAAHAKASQSEQDPNVVVVMTDDQDFRSMPVMPQTRRLIGRRGTTFDTSVVNYPLCCPSRATFLTGEYAHNHGVLWNNWPQGGYYKFDGSETLPVWLQRDGYRTIHIGKYLNEYGERDPYEVPPGWDEWRGSVDPTTYDYFGQTINNNGRLKTYGRKPKDYSTDVYARLAKQEIRKADRKGKPFFMNVAPNAPHTVAVRERALNEGSPAVPAPRDADAFADAELPRYPDFNEEDFSDKTTTLQSYFPTQLSDSEIASLTEHYRGRMGSLLAVDDLVKGVVHTLRQTGQLHNTVIVFTSDNGWILGEHRLRDPFTEDGKPAGVKYVPFEGSSRVPLMIAGPGFPAGRHVKGVTVNADLAPTIEKITGAHPTLPQDGISLRNAARHPDALKRRGVLLETGDNPRGLATYKSIRTRRYRFDLQDDGQAGLYDLKRDPWEMDSVDGDPRYARIQAILGSKLEALTKCSGRDCREAGGRLPKPGS